LATVIHVQIGSLAFGTSAGTGSLSLTLRAFDQENLEQLIEEVEKKAKQLAKAENLDINIRFQESFAVSKNDPAAAKLAEQAFESLGLKVLEKADPFRWSEDFGLFSQSCPAYLFGLGAGENSPQLHEPTYDFPDELIETGWGYLIELSGINQKGSRKPILGWRNGYRQNYTPDQRLHLPRSGDSLPSTASLLSKQDGKSLQKYPLLFPQDPPSRHLLKLVRGFLSDCSSD